MLAGMALKRRWEAKVRAEGGDLNVRKPNLVMGANVQVCWEKFCRFWEVEARLVPMEGERFHLDAQAAAAAVRREHHRRGGHPGLHLRRAATNRSPRSARRWTGWPRTAARTSRSTSTARPAGWSPRSSTRTWCGTSGCRGSRRSTPRATSTAWSTRVSAGRSWRDKAHLPEELVFRVNYLGGDMPTFALNFSRPGAQVVAQYYTFLRLGREGFTAVQQASRDVAMTLAAADRRPGDFTLITQGDELPVFAFTTADAVTGLRRLRRVPAAARARLAGARLHVPGEPGGPVGAAGGRAATASRSTWPTCSSRTCCPRWSRSSRSRPAPRSAGPRASGISA